MKRGGMSKAPQVDMKKISEQATPSPAGSKTSAVPSVNRLNDYLSRTHGDSMTVDVMGQPVKFTLQVIPADQVKRKTMVWGQNERLQELLNESTLDDLMPTFTSNGQQFPAIGRDVNGIIEVADGSRRRMAAILTDRDYRVWVGDMNDTQMASLTEVGNDYRPTSAYERGKRYKRLVEQVYGGNVKAMSTTENIARRVVIRCMATAELPLEVIRLFPNPGDLSARAGEELAKVYKDSKDAMMQLVSELELSKKTESLDADFIVKTLKAAKPTPEKPALRVRNFGAGVTAKYKGDDVEITLKGVSEALVKRIEALLEASEQGGLDGGEVEELFAKLEEKTKRP
ncbi:ParB/RepB/Spo0J family plasmid partition protein [Mixta calida]|uniref:ParB/RepB/Spo0J family plasmid partition protein n=1 Tax=Mixta calida TaxID=665913 RepID=UPI00290ADA0C|nr:ParB/RepB/Spo0J family plasmid partition protein [Mixta calida]MDU4291135.1 ParB/RepB/Spo0J family plasmid partition protein [Mixta calida]